MSDTKKEQRRLSRREALKTLTALGGLIPLSKIPDGWQEPIIERGVLPPLAQTSAVVNLSELSRDLTGLNSCATGSTTGSSFDLSFAYNDPTGGVTTGSFIAYTASISGAPPIINLDDPSVTVQGDATGGTITIDFCTNFGPNSSITETVQLVNATGAASNALTATTPKPVGAQEESTATASQRLGES